jgi:hypothetical protein
MYYLETTNLDYTTDTKSILDRQIANSGQISLICEKEINDFFYEFDRTITSFKNKIEADLEVE